MTGKQLGILLIILQQACFAAETSAIHQIGHSLTLMQLCLIRCTGGLLLVLCMLPSVGSSVLRTAQPKIQVLRAAVSIGYAFVLMYSFTTIPLADATAIGYTQAVYIVLFAGWILGEVVGLQRWLAVLVGLVGAVVLIKPSYTHTTAIYLAILLGTSLNALAVVLTRYLQRLDHPVTVMAWVNALGVLAFSPSIWQTWPALDLHAFWLLPILVIGPLGMYFGIVAVRYTDVSTLAPYTYTRLVMIGFISPLLFGEALDVYNIIGTVIIVLACVMASAPPRLAPQRDDRA